MSHFCLAFGICALIILFLEKKAPILGLVDHPDDRKHHEGRVPLVGGISIFLAIGMTSLLSPLQSFPTVLFAGGAVLLILGIVDDLRNLKATHRLIVQLVISSLLFYFGDMRIENIGPLLGTDDVKLDGAVSYLFTVFCVVWVSLTLSI